MSTALRWPHWWNGLGWLLLAAVVLLSLLPMPASAVQVPGSDKFGHLMAYFALSFWQTQLQLAPAQLLRRLLAIALIGGLIEIAQSQTGFRTGDLRDLAANLVGVVFGVVIGTADGAWLQRVEQRIERIGLRRGWVRPR